MALPGHPFPPCNCIILLHSCSSFEKTKENLNANAGHCHLLGESDKTPNKIKTETDIRPTKIPRRQFAAAPTAVHCLPAIYKEEKSGLWIVRVPCNGALNVTAQGTVPSLVSFLEVPSEHARTAPPQGRRLVSGWKPTRARRGSPRRPPGEGRRPAYLGPGSSTCSCRAARRCGRQRPRRRARPAGPLA